MKIIKDLGGKDVGEVWLEEASAEKLYYLKCVLHKNGKIKTLAKFKLPKEERRIDVFELDKRVRAIIKQIDLLNSLHLVDWLEDPTPYETRVKDKHDCDFLIDNVTIRPSRSTG